MYLICKSGTCNYRYIWVELLDGITLYVSFPVINVNKILLNIDFYYYIIDYFNDDY